MAGGFSHERYGIEQYEWYTPPEVFTALGITFDLDSCSAGEGRDHVPALRRYVLPQDGLTQPALWKMTSRWTDRLDQHRNGIALVFASTLTWRASVHAG